MVAFDFSCFNGSHLYPLTLQRPSAFEFIKSKMLHLHLLHLWNYLRMCNHSAVVVFASSDLWFWRHDIAMILYEPSPNRHSNCCWKITVSDAVVVMPASLCCSAQGVAVLPTVLLICSQFFLLFCSKFCPDLLLTVFPLFCSKFCTDLSRKVIFALFCSKDAADGRDASSPQGAQLKTLSRGGEDAATWENLLAWAGFWLGRRVNVANKTC